MTPANAMPDPDDSTLVQEILAGDTTRFAEVVRRHDEAVRRVVTRRLRDPDSVEEIVQQTFYLAFLRLDQIGEPRKLRGWLTRIAKNCVIEHRRKRRARELEPSLLEAVARDRSAEWIWAEVDRLSPMHREVIHLRYRADLSYARIAERLGVPISTVRGRIYEARKSLRRRLLE